MAITTLNLRGLNRSDTATTGQVITATSAVAADFQDAAAGSWTKLGSTTVSSAICEVDFTSVFSSTYKVYKMFVTEMTQTGSVYSEKRLQLLVGGTVQEASNSYKSRFSWNSNSSATADTWNVGAAQSAEGHYLNSNQGYFSNIPLSLSAEVTIYNPNSNTNNTVFVSHCWQRTAAYRQYHRNAGEYDTLVSATGIRFRTADDSDFHAGTFDIYGLATGA